MRDFRRVEQSSPTLLYAFVFAVLAGVLLATAHIVAGCILAVAAVACLWAWRHRDSGERGLY